MSRNKEIKFAKWWEENILDEYRAIKENYFLDDNCFNSLPKDLKEIVKPEDVDFLSQSAMDDACRPGNPRDPKLEDIKELFLSLM